MKKVLFLSMMCLMALAIASCDKDSTGTNGGGSNSNTPTRYTLTVQPNKAEWGTATGGGRYNSGARVAIEATPNTGYYFIKWSDGTESNPRTVTVSCDMTLYALFSATPNDPNPYNPDDTLAPGPQPQPSGDWIDLGLPSGTKWKATNETNPNDTYDFFTYEEAMEKFGAALPTKVQLEELKEKCQWTWDDTKKVYKVVGPNSKSIVLPAAGNRSCGGDVYRVDSSGYYWSSRPIDSVYAWHLGCNSGVVYVATCGRCNGLSVRLVQN